VFRNFKTFGKGKRKLKAQKPKGDERKMENGNTYCLIIFWHGGHKHDKFRMCCDSGFFFCIAVNLMKPDKHRNHSDFPEGDMHAGRVQERVSTTTVRAYHGNVII